jgi:hypothetical protein
MIHSWGKIYEGASNIQLIVDTDSDLTGSTILEIHVLKPDGTEVVWPASKHSEKGCLT